MKELKTEKIICPLCKKEVLAYRLNDQLNIEGGVDKVYHIIIHKRDKVRYCSFSESKITINEMHYRS